ncbi:alpha-amylase family glycosyl hydrolase [Spirochaeta dissipatitropha]
MFQLFPVKILRPAIAALLLTAAGAGILSCASKSSAPDRFRDLKEISPDSHLSMGAEQADWYKDAVFYHIWINAFHDTSGDGIGDIRGIIERLDYLQHLGITGIWLSPFFESASTAINLHMYDTTDHYRVDPRFGTNEDIYELISEAHDRGIRLIFDWVPNHISNQHPWFRDSAAGLNGRDDWFVWSDEPGNQRGPWGQQVWHRHANGRYYYGVFWDGMPDINFRNQEAKDAITNTAIYWLNKGFDGMRIDAVKYLYESEDIHAGNYSDQAENYEYFEAIREQILDAYADHRDADGNPYHKFMAAENWTDSRSSLERYMTGRTQPAFHMTLDFPFAAAVRDRNIRDLVQHWEWVTQRLSPEGWMGTFLSNHDDVAHRPMSMHGENLVRSAVAANLLGPGTPFLYYGNEIGMLDAREFATESHADRRHRQPFQWDRAEEQLQDPGSLLSFHRDLIELRQSFPALRRGDVQVISTENRQLAFTRNIEGESLLVLLSMNRGSSNFSVAIDSDEQEPELLFSWGMTDSSVSGQNLQGELSSGAVAVWKLP